MTTLDVFKSRLAADGHLAVLVTTSPQRSDPQISVVNAAVITHPVTNQPVVAFVGRPGPKLINLRAVPRATLVARAGWQWAATRGRVELIGPDDPHPTADDNAYVSLFRSIYVAAGGRHPDLREYDRAMSTERRCVVLTHPEHVWSNPPGSEHLEPTGQLQEPQP